MKLRTKGCFSLIPLIAGEIFNGHERLREKRERTIATDPQQRTILLPLIKYTTLDKPLCCSVKLDVTCNIMIDGRVWWREPGSKFYTRLVPYEHVSAAMANDGSIWK